MDFKTGEIIKTTAINNRLVYHTGILVVKDGQLLIAHNTPSRKNTAGGNVILEPFSDFLANRRILHRIPTDLTESHILAAIDEVKSIPFHVIHFNCEAFIHFVRTGKKAGSNFKYINNIFSSSRILALKIRLR